MIVPGMPACHPDDTAPAALKTIVDSIVCSHIPQADAPDLMIAVKRNAKIIHMPYNYDKTVSPLADRFIRIAVKKDKITQSDFAFEQNVFLGNEILSNEEKNRIIAPDDKKNKKEPSIAAVILAAGVSSRAK